VYIFLIGGKKKEAVAAKSSLLIDVKPWDDETPMDKLEVSLIVYGCDC
jgi:hypothetical protein